MTYVELFNMPLLWLGLAVPLGLLSEANLYGAAQHPRLPPIPFQSQEARPQRVKLAFKAFISS